MFVKTWKLPLREDFTFRFIFSPNGEFDKVAKLVCETEERLSQLYGYAEDANGIFTAVVFEQGLLTLSHECNHLAFYISEKFGVDDHEFHCMMQEWLFGKAMPILEKHNSQFAK